ncbi:MAG: RluA family pseudouridine synthase [Myxococcota bacterium]
MRSVRPYRGESAGYVVVHASERFLVVDKGPGLLTHRAPRRADVGIIELLGRTEGFVFGVHRLDQEVSGLLAFARDPGAATTLRAQFKDHTAERRYIAAVQGRVEPDQGRLEHHLAQNRGTFRMYPVPPGHGRRAVTHFWVLDRFEHTSLLEVALETGVKNQIRAQFSLFGHPLLGEQKYQGPSAIQRRRIFLHATLLSFVPPGKGKMQTWHSSLPNDLLRWRERLADGEDPTTEGRPSARASSRPRRAGWLHRQRKR